MTAETLFPGYEPQAAAPEPGLSASRRRTMRQRQFIEQGLHPLLAHAFGPVQAARLHRLASRAAQATDPRGAPFTCGSCRFRVVVEWRSRSYPKCIYGLRDVEPLDHSPRASHGSATDVRAWWPACGDYEAGDQAMGPDAMRSPGGLS